MREGPALPSSSSCPYSPNDAGYKFSEISEISEIRRDYDPHELLDRGIVS
jgi:hypothetical protein